VIGIRRGQPITAATERMSAATQQTPHRIDKNFRSVNLERKSNRYDV